MLQASGSHLNIFKLRSKIYFLQLQPKQLEFHENKVLTCM